MRLIGRVFLVLLLAFAVWFYFFLDAAGVFLTIPPKALGACTPVTGGGVVGVEDIAVDREAKIAYLSGYDRREGKAGKTVRGAIWALDLSTPGGVPQDVTASLLPGGFLPHGISLYINPADGKRSIFAVNHAGGEHSIEIFDVNGGALVHRRTVKGTGLVSPNDVVGVGPETFYVTNDHGNASGWMRTAEDYARLRQSTVQFFDGALFHEALSAIGGSNGINVSVDGRSLYLSAASERTVYIYDRNPDTNALERRAAIPVPGFADNLDVMANGDLLLALHSKIFDFLAHVGDGSKLSPSHVMLLKADGKGSFVPETIYYNDGSEISAASVGASFENRVLIGPIFEHKILDCQWSASH